MAKKKIVKPQRAVATSSVASKKQVEEAKAAKEAAEADLAARDEAARLAQKKLDQGVAEDKDDDQEVPKPADWEDERLDEASALQQLVDRLHDKGEKEVNRIIKAVEYDKRLATTYPSLQLPEQLREDILQSILSEESQGHKSSAPSSVGQRQNGEDQALLRLFVSYNVLQRLGFAEGRIHQCLAEGIRADGGWEEALEWMWLHLTEDECLGRGEHAKLDAPERCDSPLVAPVVEKTVLVESGEPPQTAPAPPTSDSTVPTPSSPLFRQLDDDSSGSDSDAGVDLNRINEKWAQYMLKLDSLRYPGVNEKKKGKKNQTIKFALETPEIRQLNEVLGKIERDYLFDRREAESILRTFRARVRADALEARLRGATTATPETPVNEDDVGHTSTANVGAGAQNEASGASGDEDGGDLFGGMLDEPEQSSEQTPQDTSGSTIPIRCLPIPKSFSFSGNIPKTLLRNAFAKSTHPVAISYIKLSGHSRAVQVGLQIAWSSTRRQVWRMDGLACENLAEAENYTATLALHDLSDAKTIANVNWRTMPPEYRELWEELEVKRIDREKTVKQERWGKITELLASRKENQSDVVPVSRDQSSTLAPGRTAELPNHTSKSKEVLEHLRSDFQKRQASVAYQTMLKQRQTLPIAFFRQQIIDTLESSQIVVLSGETGCGKSTQLPAYILEDQLAKGHPCKIYVTEPRRISAISLAQRVSQELGERPGSVGANDSLVGYSIRLEAKVSNNTRLAFVTNGIALRMLEAGSNGRRTAFDDVTHIVIDEVHERSIESDFLLIVLKQLVSQRPDLKVILMSATLDAEKISAFFGGCPTLSVPGRTFPVQVNYLEDAIELADYHIDETSPYAVRSRFVKTGTKQLEWNEEGAKSDGSDSSDEKDDDPAKLSSAKYSAGTVRTVNLLDSRQIPYDLIVRLLETICIERPEYQAFSKAILVFMPGLAEIRKLNELLQTHGFFGSADFVIFPLHSSISSEGQGAVFDIPAPGVRKIVISTNIAETGVTIPDVTCVVDCGKHREMRYDERRQISRLVETYIARDNAKQRRGRAGRVQEGLAFHLFTRARHDTQMAHHAIPEMLRLSLQDLALRIKVLKIKLGASIEEVLSKALDPPSAINIQRAVASLVEVKALTPNEEITAMGRMLSKLPMDVHLGKFLLTATLFKCLDPALTIAATLNSKSPFVTPFGFEAQADSAKRGFAVGNSDFLTLANVFASWRRASENQNYVRTFCKKNYISHQNLQQIEELRQQLLSYLIDSDLITATPAQRQAMNQARNARGNRTRFVPVPAEYDVNAESPHILSAALAAGLYPKLLNLNVNGLQTITNQQPVSMHPSSINFKVSKADFGTNYLIYFTIMQSKKLYAWETGPVNDRAIALLCGDSPDFKISASILHLDRAVKYNVHPRTAIALKALRQHLSDVMATLMKGKSLDETGSKWFALAMRCLAMLPEVEAASIGVT